jgi:hypothetical protein
MVRHMRAVVLDTNVYRSYSDTEFERLVELEIACGVYPLIDSWTMNELVAGLADSDPRERGSCLAGVRRLCARSLKRTGHVVLPAEAQVRKLLFDEESPDHEDAIQTLADCALTAGTVPDVDAHPGLRAQIAEIAGVVAHQEQWFAEHFAELSRALVDATREAGRSMDDLRAQILSENTLRSDAVATVTRAYRSTGREVPDPLPEHQVQRVLNDLRAGFVATALALELVCCEKASMNKKRNRNLIWDQEIAHNLGQAVYDLDVLVVTADKFFARAATRAGVKDAVLSPTEYYAVLKARAAA